jgi:hypothetical protein
MVESASWTDYYWALAKEFGVECLHISRSDMLASILTVTFMFLINRNSLDLRTAIQASAATLITIGVLHSFRVPWLLVKRINAKEKPLAGGWGILGIVFFVAFIVCVVYVAAWFYTMQPTVTLPPIPFNKKSADVMALQQCHDKLALLSTPERSDSLRRRTIKLVNDLNLFWSRRPAPQQQVQNPSTDEERARNVAWDRYWREVNVAYSNRDFNGKVLEIVRQYKNEGIPTGFLEQSAEQPGRLIGAPPMGGFSLDNCDRYMNELCQLRELAFHVNARDRRIDPPDF